MNCIKQEVKPHWRLINLVGKRFYSLIVQSFHHMRKRISYWECLCDCGNTNIVSSGNLRSNKVRSCGCLVVKKNQEIHVKHGKSKAPIYAIWSTMIARCHRATNTHYARYGARGITVCQRWRESFVAFLEDMGEPPEGMQLERKDNNGPYDKDNCIWATRITQANNKRNNRLVTYQGQTRTLPEWSRLTGISAATLRTRLASQWPVEDILTIPAEPGGHSARRKHSQLGNLPTGAPPQEPL